MTTTISESTRGQRADARRNREAVLAAAKQLFADEGLDAQMPDIARLANVGVGTIYRHFPRKDDLIAALAGDRFERMAQKARECLEMKDPWEGFATFIRFAAEIHADDRGLCDVTGSRPDLVGAAAEAAGMAELAEKLVKRAQRAGTLRRDVEWQDVPLVACGLASATRQALGPAAGRWPRLAEIVLDGLRAPGSAKLPKPL